jgi:hypothetical protein
MMPAATSRPAVMSASRSIRLRSTLITPVKPRNVTDAAMASAASSEIDHSTVISTAPRRGLTCVFGSGVIALASQHRRRQPARR